MTSQEAKQILLLYRPGTADALDPEVAAALELARRDPEVRRWLEQHVEFQLAMRARFRDIEVPGAGLVIARLNQRFRAEQPETRANPAVVTSVVAWWRRLTWVGAAATLAALLVLIFFWLQPVRPDRFADYQRMMVSTALRGYNMECATNDMPPLRRYFEAKGAPGDYSLAPGLGKLRLLGGTALTWRNHPVAMICFDLPDNQKVWLFVLNRSAFKDPPAATPAESKISTLMTTSWTEGDKTYVLAGPPEAGFTRRYL